MPKLLRARAPQDGVEEHKVRKLANSRHAPADWIMRARMIARSWDGLRTGVIAKENWGATLRRCASASIASTPRDSMGLAIVQVLGASRALPKRNAPRSSLLWPPILLGGWCEVLAASWRPRTKRRKLIGHWMPLAQPLGKEASPSDAAS